MPELPEVETVRRQLEPEARGRTIESAEILDERWTRPELPNRVEEALAGRRIEAVGRRGKYLIVELDDGSSLVMHLRMTGNLLIRRAGADSTIDLMEADRLGAPRLYEADADARHLRARLVLDDGSELWFTDPRRFGHAVVLGRDELDAYFASRLGIEPLGGELTPRRLLELAADRRAPLKSFLLNQTGIAGIGNIYADEALFRAHLHPLSPAGSMRLEHARSCAKGSSTRSRPAWRTAARRSTTTATRAASAARCRTSSSSTRARASRACAAARDPPDRRRRPLDLLLPGLSEASARAGAGGAGGERRPGAARRLFDRSLDRRRSGSPGAPR